MSASSTFIVLCICFQELGELSIEAFRAGVELKAVTVFFNSLDAFALVMRECYVSAEAKNRSYHGCFVAAG